MTERITQEDLLEHCLNAVRKHPYDRICLEHFIFKQAKEETSTGKGGSEE